MPFISEESSASAAGDETKTEVTDTSKSSQVAERKSKKKKEDDEVVQVEVTAKLGGIAVTVTSVKGDLSHIIIGGNYLGLFFLNKLTSVKPFNSKDLISNSHFCLLYIFLSIK